MRAAGGFYAPCFQRTKGLVDLPHMLTSLAKSGLLNRAIPTRSKGKLRMCKLILRCIHVLIVHSLR